MTLTNIPESLQSGMVAVRQQSELADGILDLDLYRMNMALMWIQITADPNSVGVDGEDLESLHDLLNKELLVMPGVEQDLTGIFSFVLSDAGKQAMTRLKVPRYQRELLEYFGILITDPDEHKSRMQVARDKQSGC